MRQLAWGLVQGQQPLNYVGIFSLNISKTKELIVIFWKTWLTQIPLLIGGATVETVSNFKFLGVYIMVLEHLHLLPNKTKEDWNVPVSVLSQTRRHCSAWWRLSSPYFVTFSSRWGHLHQAVYKEGLQQQEGSLSPFPWTVHTQEEKATDNPGQVYLIQEQFLNVLICLIAISDYPLHSIPQDSIHSLHLQQYLLCIELSVAPWFYITSISDGRPIENGLKRPCQLPQRCTCQCKGFNV